MSGSLPATEKLGHPHDQTPSIFVSAATCLAASASSLTNSSHAAFGWSPCRPPCPGADWNCSSSATRDAGMPIVENRPTSARIPFRSARLARAGPSLYSPFGPGEVKYTCRIRIAVCAACRHQSAASPPVYGGFAIVIAGVAPSLASSWSSNRTFARYCALVVLQGVGVCAPKSSFSAISGVAQPVTCTAKSNNRCAFAAIDAGSAGATVVPTRSFRWRSKKIVAAPAARICAGITVPEETARTSPGLGTIGASWPA